MKRDKIVRLIGCIVAIGLAIIFTVLTIQHGGWWILAAILSWLYSISTALFQRIGIEFHITISPNAEFDPIWKR